MKNKMIKAISTASAILILSASIAGCTAAQTSSGTATVTQTASAASAAANLAAASASAATIETPTTTTATGASLIDTTDMFSARDLEQLPDLTGATIVNLVSGQDVTLTDEGIYVLRGEATDVTVVVEAADDAKVQIVLDGVSITNQDAPAIYVKTADKVFVTTTDRQNTMKVTGAYVADGETNLDAVIFSRSDLTLNGIGTLDVVSTNGNGISSKDDLVLSGGTYSIQSAADSLEANDAILVANAKINIDSGKDALHSENADDATLGYIYMQSGTLNITAADDAIRGNSFVQIDGGTIKIKSCREGIEATQIMFNDGNITLYATDDGINAAPKVSSDVDITVNGGTINVTVGSGDTDGFDSNGNITINGGTISVTANSAFDADGTAVLNAGNVTVNGIKITQITQSQQGPGGGKGGGRRATT